MPSSSSSASSFGSSRSQSNEELSDHLAICFLASSQACSASRFAALRDLVTANSDEAGSSFVVSCAFNASSVSCAFSISSVSFFFSSCRKARGSVLADSTTRRSPDSETAVVFFGFTGVGFFCSAIERKNYLSCVMVQTHLPKRRFGMVGGLSMTSSPRKIRLPFCRSSRAFSCPRFWETYMRPEPRSAGRCFGW